MTMTAATGHGKKAARAIDAWLRGGVYDEPSEVAAVGFAMLNLPLFLDAGRSAAKRVAGRAARRLRRGGGRHRRPAGALRGRPLPLLRQLLRMRQLLRGLPGAGDHQARQGPEVRRRPRRSAPAAPSASTSARATPSRWMPEPVAAHRRRGIASLPLQAARHESSMTTDTMDGNTAVAHVAYRVNEVCAIFPITPSSPMAELADEWSSKGIPNIWGNVPVVQEMQSEGGAAGAVHGSLQSGRADDDLHRVAGAAPDAAQHVQDRRRADADGLPRRGAVDRDAGAVDLRRPPGHHGGALRRLRHARRRLGAGGARPRPHRPGGDAGLARALHPFHGRLPHLARGQQADPPPRRDDPRHDRRRSGARPSRPRAQSGPSGGARHRAQPRHLLPGARDGEPVLRGGVPASSRRRWTGSPHSAAAPTGCSATTAHPEAERVVVSMGSGAEVVRETAMWLAARGEKVGALQVLLYRPFSVEHFLAALPASVALDRRPRPTARRPARTGEPLYQDVVTALARAAASGERRHAAGHRRPLRPFVEGIPSGHGQGRVRRARQDRRRRTASPSGSTTTCRAPASTSTAPSTSSRPTTARAVFFGLGADGTVGANKNSVKILADNAGPLRAGILRLRLPQVRRRDDLAPPLRHRADPRALPHPPRRLRRLPQVRIPAAARRARRRRSPARRSCSTPPTPPTRCGASCRARCSATSSRSGCGSSSSTPPRVAQELGLGPRVNTILQTCFFAISGVLPREEAIAAIKHVDREGLRPQGRRHRREELRRRRRGARPPRKRSAVPATRDRRVELPPLVPDDAPAFVRNVTAEMMAGRGDEIPVSAMPVDGTLPAGHHRLREAQHRRRGAALGRRALHPVRPVLDRLPAQRHPRQVLRRRRRSTARPTSFPSAAGQCPRLSRQPLHAADPRRGLHRLRHLRRELPGDQPDRAGPPRHRHGRQAAAASRPSAATSPSSRRCRCPTARASTSPTSAASSSSSRCSSSPAPAPAAARRPTSSSSASSSATGCRSPTPPAARRSTAATCRPTPWRSSADGRGPAWANSLFEDNAEFGLGYRLAVDQQTRCRRALLEEACAGGRRRAGDGDPRGAAGQRERDSPRSASASRRCSRSSTAAPTNDARSTF